MFSIRWMHSPKQYWGVAIERFENITKWKKITEETWQIWVCWHFFSETNIRQVILGHSSRLAKEGHAVTAGISDKGKRILSVSPWDGTLNQQSTQGWVQNFFFLEGVDHRYFSEKCLIQSVVSLLLLHRSWSLSLYSEKKIHVRIMGQDFLSFLHIWISPYTLTS